MMRDVGVLLSIVVGASAAIYVNEGGDMPAYAALTAVLSPNAQIVTAGKGMAAKNQGFNSFFNNVRPAYIIMCAVEIDVVHAVRFARDMNLQVTQRSGLHNLGGLSFVQGGVVIDMRLMTSIEVSASDAVIKYQGGVRFGDLDKELWDKYPGWAMANGADAHIGAFGSHLGVGTGYLERWIGAGTDQVGC